MFLLIFKNIILQEEFGLTLPNWTKKYYPDKLQNLTDKSYIFNSFNKELKRLKGGVFVKKAIDEWKKKKDEKLNKKFFVYAGHDATVTNILSAFNVWEEQFPDYGICGIFEFSKHKESGKYGVEIFLKKSKDFIPLTIPGCDNSFCELSMVEDLLDDNIPKNWEEECKPVNENYTMPPLGGPQEFIFFIRYNNFVLFLLLFEFLFVN